MSEQLQDNKKPSRLNHSCVMYLAVLLGAGLLYVISCAPGSLWQDGGTFQIRIWNDDIEGDLGLALSHPLYILIGIAVKHIRLGEFAYRINLISALAGAFAVANLFLLIRLWVGRSFGAVIAAITLAVSWTVWQQTTVAEVYTLHLALLGAELIMLLQYCRTKRSGWLYLLALANGLAIANHMFAAIDFVCYAVFIVVLLKKRQINFKDIGIMAVVWIVGVLPYGYLIVKNIIETGDFAGTMASAAFGNYWTGSVLNISMSTRIVEENLMFILYNFPTPNILFFFSGLYFVLKKSTMRAFGNIFLALLALLFVFAFRYTVPDRYTFFIPFYWLVAGLIGLGAEVLASKIRSRVIPYLIVIFAFSPVAVYFVMPSFAERIAINIPTKRTIPYRNDYVWFFQPWKTGYHGPEKFADAVFSNVEQNSVIKADMTTIWPLLYAQQVNGERGDVKIVLTLEAETLEKQLAERAVYIVSNVPPYCPGFVVENYELVAAGLIWRVRARE